MKKAWYWFYFATLVLYSTIIVPLQIKYIALRFHVDMPNFIDLSDNGQNIIFFIYLFAHLLFIDKILFVIFLITLIFDIKKRVPPYYINFVSLILFIDVESISLGYVRWTGFHGLGVINQPVSYYFGILFVSLIASAIMIIILLIRLVKIRLAERKPTVEFSE